MVVKKHNCAMSYGVGHRYGLDPTLLWLWQSSGYSSDSAPSLGTSISHRCGPEKTKERKNIMETLLLLYL